MRPLLACAIAATLSLLALNAQQIAPSTDPPPSARVVLEAKGDGVQIYTCSTAPDGLKWVFKAPDAKLLDASGKVIGSHFAGPTWKLTDGGEIQGELIASKPAPAADSVPWLLLHAKPGTAVGSMAGVEFIRRTATHGGVAPASGCGSSADAGKTQEAAYTATYTFYTRP
jgi:hypothetical protein